MEKKNRGKCTTRREYMVLTHDPKCDTNSEYYYPVGQCLPKCEKGEIRRGNECVEDTYPCREGTVLHQCKWRCMEPEPMRFRKKRVVSGRLPLTKEERNWNTRKTRCKRLNGKLGGPAAYVFSEVDGSCRKKCNEADGYEQHKKRCRKKKEFRTVRKRRVADRLPSRSKSTSKLSSVGDKRGNSIGKEEASPTRYVKEEASPTISVKKMASPISPISIRSKERQSIENPGNGVGNQVVDLTGDNDDVMDLTGDDDDVMDLTGDTDVVDTNHVLLELLEEPIEIIEMRDEESVKDYLLRARFVKKRPDMVYGGTSFNEIMQLVATKSKFQVRCNGGTLLNLNSLHTLRPKSWLDDEIINMYFLFLRKRDEDLRVIYNNRRPSYYLHTHFLPTLLSVAGVGLNQIITEKYDFSKVPEWLLRSMPNLGGTDKIFIPINVNASHWILGVIFVQSKTVMMIDSLFRGGVTHKNNLLRIGEYLMHWYSDAVRWQGGAPLGDGWVNNVYAGNIRQNNGYDCGVYVIMTADFLSDNLLLPDMGANFAVPGVDDFFRGTTDLNSFRIKIGYDIMRGELDYPLLSWDM